MAKNDKDKKETAEQKDEKRVAAAVELVAQLIEPAMRDAGGAITEAMVLSGMYEKINSKAPSVLAAVRKAAFLLEAGDAAVMAGVRKALPNLSEEVQRVIEKGLNGLLSGTATTLQKLGKDGARVTDEQIHHLGVGALIDRAHKVSQVKSAPDLHRNSRALKEFLRGREAQERQQIYFRVADMLRILRKAGGRAGRRAATSMIFANPDDFGLALATLDNPGYDTEEEVAEALIGIFQLLDETGAADETAFDEALESFDGHRETAMAIYRQILNAVLIFGSAVIGVLVFYMAGFGTALFGASTALDAGMIMLGLDLGLGMVIFQNVVFRFWVLLYKVPLGILNRVINGIADMVQKVADKPPETLIALRDFRIERDGEQMMTSLARLDMLTSARVITFVGAVLFATADLHILMNGYQVARGVASSFDYTLFQCIRAGVYTLLVVAANVMQMRKPGASPLGDLDEDAKLAGKRMYKASIAIFFTLAKATLIVGVVFNAESAPTLHAWVSTLAAPFIWMGVALVAGGGPVVMTLLTFVVGSVFYYVFGSSIEGRARSMLFWASAGIILFLAFCLQYGWMGVPAYTPPTANALTVTGAATSQTSPGQAPATGAPQTTPVVIPVTKHAGVNAGLQNLKKLR